jgi:hypothetical protein
MLAIRNRCRSGSSATFSGGCGIVIAAIIVLLLLGAFVITAVNSSVITTLRAGMGLATLFANVAVSLYCLVAFRATKKRPFLSIAFAALSFANSALFSLLLGVRPPATAWHVTRPGIAWYYATYYVANLVGLVLYAWGVIELARAATRRPNQSLEPTAGRRDD